jgi:hypothetical protein
MNTSDTPTTDPEEYLIDEWQEPTQKNQAASPSFITTVGVTVAVMLILVAMGYFLQDKDFYFAAAASLAIGFALLAQSKSSNIQNDILISNLRLKIGKNVYMLSDMAGFWLDDKNGYTVINIEPKQTAVFPITFLYPEPAEEKVREILLHVLPEIESRKRDITDSINHYLRL